jgi:hypothetical protein
MNKLNKGDAVRQLSTGRRGTIVRLRGGPKGTILFVDNCGTPSWLPPSDLEYISNATK